MKELKNFKVVEITLHGKKSTKLFIAMVENMLLILMMKPRRKLWFDF